MTQEIPKELAAVVDAMVRYGGPYVDDVQWRDHVRKIDDVVSKRPAGLRDLLGLARQLISRKDHPSSVAAGLAIAHMAARAQDLTSSDAAAIIVPVLASEDEEVLEYAIESVGYLELESAILPLCELARSPSTWIRLGVAFSLGRMARHSRRYPIIESTLNELARDEADEVHEVALFMLGSHLEQFSPRSFDLVVQGMNDNNREVAEDCVFALARRRHGTALARLRELLVAPDVSEEAVFAAHDSGDRSLLPLLEDLRDAGWTLDSGETWPIDHAVEALSGPRK